MRACLLGGGHFHKGHGGQAVRERRQEHSDPEGTLEHPQCTGWDVFLLDLNGCAPLGKSHLLHSCHLSLVH